MQGTVYRVLISSVRENLQKASPASMSSSSNSIPFWRSQATSTRNLKLKPCAQNSQSRNPKPKALILQIFNPKPYFLHPQKPQAIHPWKLTWKPKKGQIKTTAPLKGHYMGFHVSLGECTSFEGGRPRHVAKLQVPDRFAFPLCRQSAVAT